MSRVHRVALLATVLGIASAADAQSTSITINCSGLNIPSTGTPPPSVSCNSGAATIVADTAYAFEFDPLVYGTGILGAIAIGGSSSNPKHLEDVLNSFQVGGQRVLYGVMRNPAGTLPTLLDTEVVSGVFSGLFISLTFKQEILPDGRGQDSILIGSRPSGLGITVQSGGGVIRTTTLPPAVVSEWQFEGDLRSVKESGLATASGPSKLRYLDDPAFGPLLGGVGAENSYPASPTPTGVTVAQSGFGTAASFGIAAVPGSTGITENVYKTSPPRNTGDPTSTAKSRGVGLSLWPNTRDFWPDGRIGQWTVVADLLIPASSWNAANAAGGDKQVVPLIEDSQNNNSVADAIIRVTGAAGSGSATAGYALGLVPGNAPVSAPSIQPDQWFRLALVVDHYGRFQSRLFVNGVFIGTTGSGWVYNACKSTDPRWGDVSSSNKDGSVVAPATWNGWGQFPSPWAKQSVSPNAPTASTLSLFADITGKGESVYVANLMFTDEAMTDAQVSALGGPNARGIVYLRPAPCPADFNGVGGVTVQDIFDFLAAYFSGDASADFNHTGGVTVQDIFDFLAAYFSGCP